MGFNSAFKGLIRRLLASTNSVRPADHEPVIHCAVQ